MADASSTEQKQAAEEPRYERDELLEHSLAWFDEDPMLVAGALAADDRKTHTKDQVKDLIRKVKRHKVDPDDGTPQQAARLAAEEEAE